MIITITKIDAPKAFLSLVMQRALSGPIQNVMGGWARYEFHKINFDDQLVESFDLVVGLTMKYRVDHDTIRRGVVGMLNAGWGRSSFNEAIDSRIAQIVVQYGLFGYLKYGVE